MKSIDIFVAYPIDDADKDPEKRIAGEVARGLATALRDLDLSIFIAEPKRKGGSEDLPDFSLNRRLLENSKALVLVTAEFKISRSSIWVEAGMALVLDIPIICIAPGLQSLPVLIQRALAPVDSGGQRGVVGLWLKPDNNVDSAVELFVPTVIECLRGRLGGLHDESVNEDEY
jgi:hypothetical protein